MIGQAGERGADAEHALLGRGEAVLNWAHQKVVNSALWNTYGTTLPEMFKRTHAYHAGGHGAPGYARGRYPDLDGAGAGFGPFMQYFQSKFGKNLYVMSGFRPGSITTSGNMSNHAFRRAVDISTPTIAGATQSNPPPRTNVDALHAFISRYIPAPPRLDFLWRTMVGGNHFNHIHLGISEMISGSIQAARRWIGKNLPEGEVFGGGMAVKLRKVLGADGPMKNLVEALIKRVTKAANKFVDTKMDESMDFGDGPGPASVALGEGGRAEQIFDYFVNRGFSENQAAAFVGNFFQESGLSTTVRNPSSGATGLAQWLGGRLTGLMSFARERGDSPYSLQTQLDYVWHELMGPENSAYSAIKGARSLPEAVSAIAFKYERMGAHEAALGNRIGAANTALENFGGSSDHGPRRRAEGGFAGEYAKGGELPGRDGEPVPIIAHAGEWVLNRVQQSRLASMLGMSAAALRQMLGFTGEAKGAFEDGGDIVRRPRRGSASKGVYEPPVIDPTSLDAIEREVDQVYKAIRQIGRRGKLGTRISQVHPGHPEHDR